ncbi:MAG TPA: hypothetical protein VF120_11570 [Ktedonobacterales bacterium]
MIERLQRALKHIDELSSDVQEQIARIIEDNAAPSAKQAQSLAGAWSDLPDTFDEMLDTLDRIRHESPPTPPTDEQLAWMDEGELK